MIKHKFVFEGGIAKIKDVETDATLLAQPGLPGPEGLTPWESEEQASNWIHAQFESFFVDLNPEPPPGAEPPAQEQTTQPESGA